MMKSLWKWLIRRSSIWKTALAAGLAWEVAKWTGAERPYFAPLAAILCLQVTVEESIWRGYQRVLGIIVGVLLSTALVRAIGLHGWSIAFIVLAGTGIATWLRLGNQAIPQVGVSAMMVMTVGGQYYTYAYERIVDTILGAVIAVLVNMFVIPPDYTRSARSAVSKAAGELSERFQAMGLWVKNGANVAEGEELQQQIRAYIDKLHSVADDVTRAVHAVRFSPLVVHRRKTLAHLDKAMFHLRQGYAHAAGMVRTLLEWQQSGLANEQALHPWSERCFQVSEVLQNWSQAVLCNETELTTTRPGHEGSVNQRDVDEAVYETALWNDIRQVLQDFRVIE